MKKVKLQLPTGDWDDIVTKYAPDDSLSVSQNAFTTGTKNIDTDTDGSIRKMKGGIEFASLSSPTKDQHEAIFSDGARHLLVVENGILKYTAGTPSMTTVTSGYSTAGNFEFATTNDRVYFGNGINANQVYDKTVSYGGVTYSVPQTKAMGAQTPSSAATATLGAAGSNVPAGAHTYKVTFLYYDAEESNGSPTSNLVTVTGANEQVDLTSIPIGGYGVTARKLYRDNNDGVYTLIGTISDNTTTTFSDTVAGGTTPIPVDNGFAPAFGLIKLFLGRLFFGKISGEPFTIYFSEAGLPDIVESTNFIDCNPEDPITGMQVYRGRLVVFNRRSMGQILGSNRDDFRYDSIESSVGCVDNRTIQEVVLNGVPVLIWLSDKGFYGFNGSSIFDISNNIENIVNSDIQQSVIQRNEHVDTTNADFTSGTPSDGIDIAGGQISVRGYVDGTSTVGNNPRRIWNDTADWDNGSSLDNISTINQSNQMTIVADNSQEPATDGTKDSIIASGVGVALELTTDFTGESDTAGNWLYTGGGTPTKYAYPIIPERTGTIDTITFHVTGLFGLGGGATVNYSVKIWEDVFGEPGTEIYSAAKSTITDDGGVSGSLSVAFYDLTDDPLTTPLSVTGGQKYWIGIEAPQIFNGGLGNLSGGTALIYENGWISVTPIGSVTSTTGYAFTSTAVASSGTWTSEIIDTESDSADPTNIIYTANYPTGTGSTTIIDGGDALDFAGNLVVSETQTLTDHTGTGVITLGSRRYYQVRITLTTDDDRVVPDVSTAVQFNFNTTAEWVSDIVDTTGDSTAYNNLTTTTTTPGSSTVVTEIRTAATIGGIPGASWVPFGSVSVDKYAQMRLTLTKDGANLPSVSLLDFDWTIVSNLISQAIDTTVDPSGWDVFTSDFATNGGTVIFEMRSATTEGGLSGATWYTVTNGAFPTVSLPTDQWVQWRATITATDTNVPIVSSVTIKWLVGDVDNIRAASIFYDKSYYVALAEFGSSVNNIILQFDSDSKWRIRRGLGISTIGFFFNEPYFGSSDSNIIGKFLQGFQDLGTDIEIDIRTKAFDFSSEYFDNSEYEKIPESFTIEGRGTGATYDVSYSLDNGSTFTNFVDVMTGSTTYTTTNDDKLFARIFRVDASTNGFEGAKTIMYRIHTDDEYDIKLHRIKATAFITRKDPIITG